MKVRLSFSKGFKAHYKISRESAITFWQLFGQNSCKFYTFVKLLDINRVWFFTDYRLDNPKLKKCNGSRP